VIKQKVIALIAQKYSTLSPQVTESLIVDNLFSPFQVRLPKEILTQAQDFVRQVFLLRESKNYTKPKDILDPGNKSILMSYDFHLDQSNNLKLIEINTNAAFLALGELMYQAHELPQPVSGFTLNEIAENIQEELNLNGQKDKASIAIIDEEPEKQKLYIEFLVYNEFFKSKGFQSIITDFRNIPDNVNFIYNRYTDFYFDHPESLHLKKLFSEKKVCFSPNPFEYELLANKQRMIDWSIQGLFKKNLPYAQKITSENQEQIWTERKKYFFKPLQSFGSKQSYRGEKISRKMFEKIPNNGFIAQEYIEPPKMTFITPSGEQEYKFDLRFYAYKDRVQSVIARIYQGQVTNLQTPYGGFAPVVLV